MRRDTLCYWAVVVVIGLLATGCAPPEVERPDTTGVTGTVTLNGEPVEAATVTFVADGEGQDAIGRTDANGKYTLTTFGGSDGAIAGEYKVKIAKYTDMAADTTSGEAGEDGEGGYIEPNENDTGEQENVLPAKYADEKTSELTASVSAGATSFDFDLVGE